MSQTILSIAIPYYNGYDTTIAIIDELASNSNAEYEIVISDDCSNAKQSDLLVEYISLNFSDSNIIYSKNQDNLGMDLNFEKCISLSNSEFTWFMGQDDFIYKSKLLKVISLLKLYQPHVVYLNYEVRRTWNYQRNFIHTDNLSIETGETLEGFYQSSRGNVPHFLPSLIVRNSVWPDNSTTSIFQKTYFIQLGAFLSILSEHKRWLYIGEPMSVGSIPQDGWQSSIEKKVKIYAGFMDCIRKSSLAHANLKDICHHQYNKNKYQHLSLSIESKVAKDQSLVELLKSRSIFSANFILITKFVEVIPTTILGLFINFRKLYFKLLQYKSKPAING